MYLFFTFLWTDKKPCSFATWLNILLKKFLTEYSGNYTFGCFFWLLKDVQQLSILVLHVGEVKYLWLFHQLQPTAADFSRHRYHPFELWFLLLPLLFLLNFSLLLTLHLFLFEPISKVIVVQMNTKKLDKSPIGDNINPPQTFLESWIDPHHIRLRLFQLVNKIPPKRVVKLKDLLLQHFLI